MVAEAAGVRRKRIGAVCQHDLDPRAAGRDRAAGRVWGAQSSMATLRACRVTAPPSCRPASRSTSASWVSRWGRRRRPQQRCVYPRALHHSSLRGGLRCESCARGPKPVSHACRRNGHRPRRHRRRCGRRPRRRLRDSSRKKCDVCLHHHPMPLARAAPPYRRTRSGASGSSSSRNNSSRGLTPSGTARCRRATGAASRL